MEHPLLMDVCIHHFDVFRYLTGEEMVVVQANEWKPIDSHYKHNPCADGHFLMTNDIHVSFRGSLTYFQSETDFIGDWRIEGSKGVIRICSETLTIITKDEVIEEHIPVEGESLGKEWECIKNCLRTGARSSLNIEDNIRTFRMVQEAIRSSSESWK